MIDPRLLQHPIVHAKAKRLAREAHDAVFPDRRWSKKDDAVPAEWLGGYELRVEIVPLKALEEPTGVGPTADEEE